MTANRYPFDNQVVLVTGAGAGIGAATARAFLDNGARVAALDVREEPLREVLAGYSDERVQMLAVDLRDAADTRRAVASVVERFGGLDVVVSNAGIAHTGEFTELGDAWVDLRETNIDGFVHLATAVLPHLEVSRGSLIATSSVSGFAGDWGQAAYNATKHAISGFVRSLALDYGERGVRVNAVAPAFTLTHLTSDGEGDDRDFSAHEDRTAAGRIGFPDDIAPAILFLASPDAAYITGVILPVDGGTSASTGQAR